jgi:hypothetical protein
MAQEYMSFVWKNDMPKSSRSIYEQLGRLKAVEGHRWSNRPTLELSMRSSCRCKVITIPSRQRYDVSLLEVKTVRYMVF